MRWPLALVTLSTLDWTLTQIGLTLGAAEINPAMAAWIHSHWAFLAKTVGVAGIAWYLRNSTGIRVMVAVYGAVVAWNLSVILRLM